MKIDEKPKPKPDNGFRSLFDCWFFHFSLLTNGKGNQTKPFRILFRGHSVRSHITLSASQFALQTMPQPTHSSSALFLSEEARNSDLENVDLFTAKGKKSKYVRPVKKKPSSAVPAKSMNSTPIAVAPLGNLSFRTPCDLPLSSDDGVVSQDAPGDEMSVDVFSRNVDETFGNFSDGENYFGGEADDSGPDLHDEPDQIFSDPVELEQQNPMEYDGKINSTFVQAIQNHKCGEVLYNSIFKLSNTGNTTGFSITMNRAVKCLSLLRLLPISDVGSTTWSKCKKDGRDNLVKKLFLELEVGSNTWNSVTSAILDGFIPRKLAVKKVSVPVSTKDDDLYVKESTGSICDRTTLLACAIADPELLHLWQDISKPINVDARPGNSFLILMFDICCIHSNIAFIRINSNNSNHFK